MSPLWRDRSAIESSVIAAVQRSIIRIDRRRQCRFGGGFFRSPATDPLVCFALLAFNNARAENASAPAKDPVPQSAQEFADKARSAHKLNSPDIAVTQTVKISNDRFAFLGSVIAVVLAYGVIVLGVGRIRGDYRWDPVYLTSNHFDKASLSRLQLLGFTLLVWGLLVFILLRTKGLSDISKYIL